MMGNKMGRESNAIMFRCLESLSDILHSIKVFQPIYSLARDEVFDAVRET